jgi:glucose/arabinose dehydrogenase
MRRPILSAIALSVAGIVSIAALPLFAQTDGKLLEGKLLEGKLLEGKAAFGDWHNDKPGTRRLIKPQDLPPPGESSSAVNFVRVQRRSDQKPAVPPGFEVNLFASGLAGPRTLRTAPNGDIFVAESGAGRVSVLRPTPARRQSPRSLHRG